YGRENPFPRAASRGNTDHQGRTKGERRRPSAALAEIEAPAAARECSAGTYGRLYTQEENVGEVTSEEVKQDSRESSSEVCRLFPRLLLLAPRASSPGLLPLLLLLAISALES